MKKYQSYLILIVITLAVFYVAWWILAQYQITADYRRNISALDSYIPYSLQPEELEPYLMENGEVFMYVVNTHERGTARFESMMRGIIRREEFLLPLVMYNTSTNPNQLLIKLKEVFDEQDNLDLIIPPALLFIKDGVLIDVINMRKNYINSDNNILDLSQPRRDLTAEDIRNFMRNYGMLAIDEN